MSLSAESLEALLSPETPGSERFADLCDDLRDKLRVLVRVESGSTLARLGARVEITSSSGSIIRDAMNVLLPKVGVAPCECVRSGGAGASQLVG
jgi:hypothetical protein